MDLIKLKITANFLPVPLETNITGETTVSELEELLKSFNIEIGSHTLTKLVIADKCYANYNDGLMSGLVEITLTDIKAPLV